MLDRRGSAASRGNLAYCGSYEVDAARGVVIHKREFTSSGDASVDAVRGFEFDGDLLTLTLTVEPAR
ncbi:MAG: lipocalin-like domain-containing protein [Gammaproteobacteria bacterium]|nr:lipocalin-like domain-containing protein [Gammaproteobacteria bacterium]MDE0248725.1 lipocalin-like domain-containing protein [Gammaproteobacteria bacterium]